MFYCIGGANIDIYARSLSKIKEADSNIGKIGFAYGGVGHNVAVNLRDLGETVSFISVFGDDGFGKDLYTSLKNKGIGLEYAKLLKNHCSSLYLAVLDDEDLFVGVSDMSILSELKIADLLGLKNIVQENDYVYFDSNFNEEISSYIANEIKGLKIADGISASKVKKLSKILNKLDVLKLNELEARTLLDDDTSDLVSLIKKINEIGTKEVLVSKTDRLYVGVSNKVFCFKHNVTRTKPTNVTGAGDALLSAFISSRSRGFSVEKSSCYGLVAGILTVDVNEAIRGLNYKLLDDMLSQIEIDMEVF